MGWNDSFVDGDYVYSRAVSRMFYDAVGEREATSLINGRPLEVEFGIDATGDALNFPAMVGRTTPFIAFGGMGYLHGHWYPLTDGQGVGGPGGYYNVGGWADPTATVTSADAADGSTFSPYLTPARVATLAGLAAGVKRTCPRTIASAAATEDQFGNAAAAGQLARWGNFTWLCVTAGEWIRAPQSARPDLLDSTAGDIPPTLDDVYDGDGVYLGHLPVASNRGFTVGDYMGLHLWRQTRDVLNLLGVHFHGPPNYNPGPSWPIFDDGTHTGAVFGSYVHSKDFNGVADVDDGETWADAAADLAAVWASFPGGTGPGEPGAAAYGFRSRNEDGDQEALSIRAVAGVGEVGWFTHHRWCGARLRFYALATQPDDYLPEAVHTATFDAMGTGLVEGQWNLVDDRTVPADRTDPIAPIFTGVTLGDVSTPPAGVEPVAVAPGGASSTATGWRVPYVNGRVGLVDYRVPGGFTYRPD